MALGWTASLLLGVIGVSYGAAPAHADGEIVVGLAEPDDSAFPEVSVIVTADQAGRPLGDLNAAQLRVSEGGTPAVLIAVRRAQDSGTPLALVVTIDTSGSMQGPSMEQAQAAAGALLRRLAPDDAAAVVAFSDGARVAQPLTNDRSAAQRAVAGLVPSGNTALYDAVAESARVAAESGRARRAVVMLSDGREFGGASRLTREQSLESAARGGAVFYMVGVGPDIDAAYLEEIATRSGGRFFRAAGASDVQQVYAALEELLRSQYVVTMRSAASAAGVDRQLAVEVRTGDGQGRAERAYASRRPDAASAQQPAAPPAATPTVEDVVPAAPAWPLRIGGVEITSALLTIAAGASLGGLALGGAGYYLGRVRPRRKSPVKLKTLRRGIDVVSEAPFEPSPDPVIVEAPVTLLAGTGRASSYGLRDAAGAGAWSPALLRVSSGPSKGATVALPFGSVLIGTAPDCDVRVDASAGVAERHARVFWREGHALIEHIATGFETRVNGRAIDCAPLDFGYDISIGSALRLRFELAAAAIPTARRDRVA